MSFSRNPHAQTWAYPAVILLLSALLLLLSAGPSHAQAPTYTVQFGDTLGEIATRFGVSVEELAAANNLQDVNVLDVGQVLVIPSGQGSGGPPSEWFTVAAHPRQTLASIASQYGLEVSQLAAYNKVRESTRLFPGQPIRIPAEQARLAGESFGALRVLAVSSSIEQGRTGLLRLQMDRPLAVRAVWNGLPLVLIPAGEGDAWFAPVPVPALLALRAYPLEIGYTAASGVDLTRTLSIDVRDGGYASQSIILPDDKSGLLAPELVQREEALVREIWTQRSPTLWWTGVFSRPVTAEFPTTSPFGIRRSYNGGPMNSYHAGEDFGAPTDTPIYAPAGGVVALAEELTVRGKVVIIDHGQGLFTGYWHLNGISVQPGQQVETGELIGLIGTTGLSTGAHLHWELRIFGIAVDPMQFLDQPLAGESTG